MTSGPRRAAVMALAVSLAVHAHVARAEPRSGAALVAIVTSEPSAPVTRRVAAQLEAIGLDVMVLNPPAEATPTRAPLEQAARNVGALAAVRIVHSGEGRIEVWVADRVTGKAVVREIPSDAAGGSDAAVATEAVELLRASLMEIHSAEPPRGEVPATPAIAALALAPPPAPPPPWRPRLAVAIGADAELAGASTAPTAGIELGAWIRLRGAWGLRVLGRAPLAPARVATLDGTVDVASSSIAALVSCDLVDPADTWVPSLSLGVEAVHVATSGAAALPYAGVSDDAWRAAPVADLGLAWSFARGLRLRADARGAWLTPGLAIRTPSSNLGSWGAPAASFALAVEVLWSP